MTLPVPFFLTSGDDIFPRFCADFFPVERRQDFEQFFLAPHLEGAFVDFVPDAGTGFVHVAMFGCGTAAGTVAQSFRTFHRADEGRFLQQAVAAHAAAEERSFDHVFNIFQQLWPKGSFLNGE